VGLSGTFLEIIDDLGRKRKIFSRHVYLRPMLWEFPLEFCNGGGLKKYNDALTRCRKSMMKCMMKCMMDSFKHNIGIGQTDWQKW